MREQALQKFATPKMEVIVFETEQILTASPESLDCVEKDFEGGEVPFEF